MWCRKLDIGFPPECLSSLSHSLLLPLVQGFQPEPFLPISSWYAVIIGYLRHSSLTLTFMFRALCNYRSYFIENVQFCQEGCLHSSYVLNYMSLSGTDLQQELWPIYACFHPHSGRWPGSHLYREVHKSELKLLAVAFSIVAFFIFFVLSQQSHSRTEIIMLMNLGSNQYT